MANAISVYHLNKIVDVYRSPDLPLALAIILTEPASRHNKIRLNNFWSQHTRFPGKVYTFMSVGEILSGL